MQESLPFHASKAALAIAAAAANDTRQRRRHEASHALQVLTKLSARRCHAWPMWGQALVAKLSIEQPIYHLHSIAAKVRHTL